MAITAELELYEFTRDGDEEDPMIFPMLVGAEAVYSGKLEAALEASDHLRRFGAPVVHEQLLDSNN